MFHAVGQLVGYSNRPHEASEPQGKARPSTGNAKAAAPAGGAPVAEAPAPVAEAPTPPAKVEATPFAKPTPSLGSSAAFQDTDGDLYRLAHEAHFSSHDYARALTGWNAYLQAAPNGRLAPEARYNRAICLLRLGRDAEARQALEPFASGKMGYRKNEARALLEELSR
jgi:TolA-binding protein